jgi:hypothetical protein
MFKGLHNKLGEHGQALTVLSLLEGPEYAGSREDISGSLHDVAERLRAMAGGNDAELVSMYSVYPNEGGSLEFLALELVPLRQAIARINQINGAGSDDAETLLSVVDRPDDDVEDGDTEGSVSQAFSHLRDALRNLFNRAGENGQSLTVLSLLSQPVKGNRPND